MIGNFESPANQVNPIGSQKSSSSPFRREIRVRRGDGSEEEMGEKKVVKGFVENFRGTGNGDQCEGSFAEKDKRSYGKQYHTFD